MRITKWPNRYHIRCTDHEFEILQIALAKMQSDDLEHTGQRKSWSRRIHQGEFLRVDRDWSYMNERD